MTRIVINDNFLSPKQNLATLSLSPATKRGLKNKKNKVWHQI
jgi:hypothetical protein